MLSRHFDIRVHHPKLFGRYALSARHISNKTGWTYSDMIVLPARGELVRLPDEVLVLGWTRLLEGHRLEVAGRDGLAVVPANFEGPDTHFGRQCVVAVRTYRRAGELYDGGMRGNNVRPCQGLVTKRRVSLGVIL